VGPRRPGIRDTFLRAARRRALLPASYVLVGALLTGVIVTLFGASPAAAFAALLRGALGSVNGITESLLEAIPLAITGLGVALAFRAHLWNIGAEGQLLVGELAAIGTGLALARAPSWAALPGALAAGTAAGGVWAGFAALLRVYRRVPEVIATIMLNFLALYLVSWATTGPLREPGQEIPRTALLPEPARLPAVGTSGLHAGLYLAPVVALLLLFLVFRTVPGFRIRAVGFNPAAAAAAGIPVPRTLLQALMLSGGLAGLAGAVQLCGVTYRLYGGSSPGTGYTAIAVALVGKLHPVGVLLSACFFGALVAGCNEMQRTAGVSSVVAYVIQALAVFLVIAAPRAGDGFGRGERVRSGAA
jgi:ABC-type uncharacterized transport system permease subunit